MIKTFVKYSVLVLLASACGKPEAVYQVDGSLKPFVDDFVATAQTYGAQLDMSNIVIEPAALASNINGVCIKDLSGNEPSRIQINSTKFASALNSGEVITYEQIFSNNIVLNAESDTTLRMMQTIAHEIGHCAMGLGHINDKTSTFYIPKSVMNAFSFSSTKFLANLDIYLRNMVGQQFADSVYEHNVQTATFSMGFGFGQVELADDEAAEQTEIAFDEAEAEEAHDDFIIIN